MSTVFSKLELECPPYFQLSFAQKFWRQLRTWFNLILVKRFFGKQTSNQPSNIFSIWLHDIWSNCFWSKSILLLSVFEMWRDQRFWKKLSCCKRIDIKPIYLRLSYNPTTVMKTLCFHGPHTYRPYQWGAWTCHYSLTAASSTRSPRAVFHL